jgi:hypothetical protein
MYEERRKVTQKAKKAKKCTKATLKIPESVHSLGCFLTTTCNAARDLLESSLLATAAHFPRFPIAVIKNKKQKQHSSTSVLIHKPLTKIK